MKREKIELTENEMEDFDFTGGDQWELRNETYDFVETIRTDEFSDGPSWDTIVKRKSDGKFFKWNCWDTSRDYQMESGDNYMEEVFSELETKIIYK